ncbi:MAG: ATP-grasp domain-containing protein [Pyrinomonadaceae bacterium]
MSIGIYYEHPEWFRALFAVLEKRGVEYEKIDAANHSFSPEDLNKFPVVFNRMSASAYLRDHQNAVFYTRGLLANLERSGVRVINGRDAYEIEISKALQVSLFALLGVKFPKTRVINSLSKLVDVSDSLTFPLVIKPNIGGRGAGIVKFDSREELRNSVEENLIDLGIDGTLLVQEYIPKRGDHINRVETLEGKFLYGLKIYPNDESFNLCPAEFCEAERKEPEIGFCLTDAPKMGLKIENFDPPAEIIATVESIVKEARIDVGGVEYLIDDRTGDALFYDINALSNFVADAVNLIGFDPHENLVDYLEKEIEKCVTDIGCRSLAVG